MNPYPDDPILAAILKKRADKKKPPAIDDFLSGLRDFFKGESPVPGEDFPIPKDGEPGHTPTEEELKALIEPLIPDPIPGKDGDPGEDGYTPKKGKDYFDGKDGSPDTPSEIAAKLNKTEQSVEAKVIKDLPTYEGFIKELKKKQVLEPKDIKGMPINMNDMRWHGSGGASTAGTVKSVTGLNTDNTDPTNPIVQISVDGTTITGAGTPGSPLVGTVTTAVPIPTADDTLTGPNNSSFNAGTTVAQWEAVYLDSSSTWQLTDADVEATAGSVNVALATEAGTAGNPLNVALPGSYARNDAWSWIVGGPIYLSTTAGALTQTQPMLTDSVVRVVGYAVTADIIFWEPSDDYCTVTSAAGITPDSTTIGGYNATMNGFTIPHTCAGLGRVLVVGTFGRDGGIDSVTGVTYNGVAMTKVGSQNAGGADNRYATTWFLPNPAIGTHNLVASASGGDGAMDAVSYNGALNMTIDNFTTKFTNGTPATSITTSLTPNIDNCWTVICARYDSGTAVSGAGSYLRLEDPSGLAIYDSNAPIHPAGSYSMTVGSSASCNIGLVMASFASIDTATLKTVNGIPL